MLMGPITYENHHSSRNGWKHTINTATYEATEKGLIWSVTRSVLNMKYFASAACS